MIYPLLPLFFLLLWTPPTEQVTDLTLANFDSIALDKTKNVFVDFYGANCPACKTIGPLFEKAGAQFESDDCVIGKVDTATETGLHTKYNVNELPSFVFFSKDDKSGEMYQGEKTEAGFAAFLKEKCGGGDAAAVAKKKKQQ